jgi:hypothetical protein
MGIRAHSIKLLEDARVHLGYENWNGVSMYELGSQDLRKGGGLERGSSKDYFEKLGVKHDSIDIDGRHKCLVLDLSKEINSLPEYDVLSNYGTSEHIFNQYMVFKNIHNFVRVGGAMVHFVPATPYWKRHGFYTYSEDYFNSLADKNNYEVVTIKGMTSGRKKSEKNLKNMIAAILIKRDNEFVSEEEFDKIEGRRRTRVKAGGQNTK